MAGTETEIKAVTALYARLSQDDETDMESNSIVHQKEILSKFAKENGFGSIRFYSDDGVSGTTFERDGFKQMIADIESGEVKAVIVKDLSRLGRNHIMVGYYTEIFFPDNDVRFIAIYDGVDSDKGDNEFAPFKNIMNEWYARDTSRKIRAVLYNKGMSGGILCTVPPYGYMNDPDDKNHWLIDEEAAEVVRLIFDMYIKGSGFMAISHYLWENKVPTPTEHQAMNGLPGRHKANDGEITCNWNTTSIRTIIANQDYCGDVVNFKTYKKSYKQGKRYRNSEENFVIFKGVNPPIISEETFQKAAELKAKRMRVPTVREPDMFQGFLRCSDCGKGMSVIRANERHPAYYMCNTYRRNSRQCSTHYINAENLTSSVLSEIRGMLADYMANKKKFTDELYAKAMKIGAEENTKSQKELKKLNARIAEIDKISKKLYEDRALRNLPDETYFTLAAEYKAERKEIEYKISQCEETVRTEEKAKKDIQKFIKALDEFENTDVTEITRDVLDKLVDKIIVGKVVKGSDEKRIKIAYKYIGALD